MTKAKKKKKPNGVKPVQRVYERTTPVGRVRKHLAKSLRIAEFAVDRMTPWEHSTDGDLVTALASARGGIASLEKAYMHVDKLFTKEWVPPKRSTVATFSEGEDVRIAERHRAKYLHLYTTQVIENLVIAKCLPTGEIAVRHGINPPFLVPKSHVERKRSKATDQSTNHAHPLK